MKTCFFCGPTDADLSKEELFPKWLAKFFRELGVKYYETTLTPTRTRARKMLRVQNFEMHTVNGICTNCNNETLSDLENQYIKVILKHCALYPTAKLSTLHQAALNAWITRFAMLSEHTGNFTTPYFTQADRKQFITTLEPPSDCWIWIGSWRSSFFVGSASSVFTFPDGSRGFVATGVAGRLAFQFLLRRWPKQRPSDDHIAALMRPILETWLPATIQIHPLVYSVAQWPPSAYLNDRAMQAFCRRWGGNAIFGS